VAEPIPAPKQVYVAGRLSPDGQKIVTFTNDRRVWVYDLARRILTPLTPQQEPASWGTFSPDGTRVAFQLTLVGDSAPIALRAADGTGNSERIHPAAGGVQSPGSWSIDDKIAYVQGSETTANDIWVFDVRTKKSSLWLQTPAAESFPAFSPDGKWLAYVSTQSGTPEAYVQPYPGPGPAIQVSNGGASAPVWAAGELFYRGQADGTFRMMSVKVTTTSTSFSAGVPQKVFEGLYGSTTPARGWDVTADGRRFLLIRGVEAPPQPTSQMVLVQNFGEELKRVAK
jgi:serine/threonine-protein kinase